MGALTDSRKRVSADHRLHPSFPPSPPPPSKRTKLAPLLPVSSPPPLHYASPSSAAPGPSSSAAAAAATASTSSHSSLPHPRRRLPPAPPISRPIHGPQRVRRSFRGGNSRPNSNPPWYSPSPPPKPLGLDQYADLVYSVTHPPRPTPAVHVPRGTEAIPEVVMVDDNEDIRQDKEDEQDVEEEAKAKVVGRKVPLYKELYEKSSRQRDARLRTLEFEVQLAEKGRLGLERLAEVLPRITPNKEEVPEPFVPLTDEDEDNVRHALGGRKSETLSVHEASNIVITREILQCLNDKEWLNDEVINLYLELLKERELREPNKFLKCHFFNTFFYKKLINGGYDYKSVRRWTTKRKLGYNLIDCDKIFVPIHKDVHWCLAVINIKEKKFQYLDSLGYMDMKALRILAKYLVDEVKDKSGKQIDVHAWKQEGVQNLPLQENGWDCGMFMLKYIDFYSRDMELVFGQKHMSYFRRRTAKEILDLKAG
ncbi:hypothetical protein BRADI_2g12720v3 [Brachypodium distachyon]|uniref:Ubiquitin-like protease family profile domain-containing protein n=1 Tax=Brachypodium distachyon TaxID=15368 RepID=A0A0Q3G109_BRADI|nr:hypothetical protein BRADI_2g12720v3 [Brachypodium distachyon]